MATPDDALTAFDFRGANVRALLIDSEPWWIATDVCSVLALGNPRSSLARLDEDEKGVHTMDTPGGPQQMVTVNESGLYSLILRSRKEEAKAFKRWITRDVLPSLRRTGSYGVRAARPAPTTVTWDQAAAIARLQYGLDVDTSEFRELLNKGGILKNTLAPHRKWEYLFWPLPSRWEIHAHVLPQLVHFAAKVRRDLLAAEQDLQMSLPLPMSVLLADVDPGAEVVRLPRQLRGGAA